MVLIHLTRPYNLSSKQMDMKNQKFQKFVFLKKTVTFVDLFVYLFPSIAFTQHLLSGADLAFLIRRT